jgi:hypothetical protein
MKKADGYITLHEYGRKNQLTVRGNKLRAQISVRAHTHTHTHTHTHAHTHTGQEHALKLVQKRILPFYKNKTHLNTD